jgi:hypothetical protein
VERKVSLSLNPKPRLGRNISYSSEPLDAAKKGYILELCFSKTSLAKYISNPKNGFGAATEGEQIVFGARRPGFPFTHVSREVFNNWLAFMQHQSIQQIVCLLPPKQLAYYADDLLGAN